MHCAFVFVTGNFYNDVTCKIGLVAVIVSLFCV